MIRLSLAALVLLGTTAAQAQVKETFSTTWVPNRWGEPTDGVFKADGPTCVSYSGRYPNELNLANVTFPTAGGHTLLDLTVQPGTSKGVCGTSYGAAEVMTDAGWTPGGGSFPYGSSPYGYGYYMTSMRPSCVQGEISSFFWIQAPNYGPLEIDVEFPNPPGHNFNDVHWTIHPSGKTLDYNLGFNPCQGFHQYGFIWTAGQVQFVVDGAVKYTMTDPSLVSTVTGFIMANAWTGNPNWGGGPPTQAAVNTYRGFWYMPNMTQLPKH